MAVQFLLDVTLWNRSRFSKTFFSRFFIFVRKPSSDECIHVSFIDLISVYVKRISFIT